MLVAPVQPGILGGLWGPFVRKYRSPPPSILASASARLKPPVQSGILDWVMQRSFVRKYRPLPQPILAGAHVNKSGQEEAPVQSGILGRIMFVRKSRSLLQPSE